MHNLLIYFEELKSVVILLAPTLDSPSGGGKFLYFSSVKSAGSMLTSNLCAGPTGLPFLSLGHFFMHSEYSDS